MKFGIYYKKFKWEKYNYEEENYQYTIISNGDKYGIERMWGI